MNNEAFQALVRERSSGKEKSTKEIAREAVEEEFRRNKRKRRRGDSSSDDDSDNRSRRRQLAESAEERQRHQQQSKVSNNVSTINATIDNKYRDRAKERREGKLFDYNQAATTIGVLTKTDNIYGDQSGKSNSEVKGLDDALIRKAKNVIGVSVSWAATPVEDAKAALPSLELVQNRIQAEQLLQRRATAAFTSDLGKGMFEFLQRRYLQKSQSCHVLGRNDSTSAAGFAIQRSTLTLSLNDNPYDKIRAWEAPMEITHASSTSSKGQLARLDYELLGRIANVLRSGSNPTPFPSITVQSQPEAVAKNKNASNPSQQLLHVEPAESDDEDIFGEFSNHTNVKMEPSDSNEIQAVVKKGSIFLGLATSSGQTENKIVHPKCAHPIANEERESKKMLEKEERGIPMSAFGSDYGEDLDVDFDGRFAEEDDDDDGDKSKSKKEKKKTSWTEATTLAAKEYGSGKSRKR